jgi:hypothetical protein
LRCDDRWRRRVLERGPCDNVSSRGFRRSPRSLLRYVGGGWARQSIVGGDLMCADLVFFICGWASVAIDCLNHAGRSCCGPGDRTMCGECGNAQRSEGYRILISIMHYIVYSVNGLCDLMGPDGGKFEVLPSLHGRKSRGEGVIGSNF